MITVPAYNQWDKRWTDRVLAPSTLTLGRYGCFVTSVASLLSNYAITVTPDELLQKLVKVNGFTNDGYLKHEAINRIYPDVVYYERAYTTNDKSGNFLKMQIDVAIKKVLNLLRLGQCPILCVDNVFDDGLPDHATVLIAGNEDLRTWTIMNPDAGIIQNFWDKYGDPEKKLYGFVSYLGQPINFPPDGNPRNGQIVAKLSQARRGMSAERNISESLDLILGV